MRGWPSRREYLERLVPRAKGAIVLSCLGAASEQWGTLCPADSNFYLFDFMGMPIPLALGVALARPDRRVIAMEGDGGLLMDLGALVTVAKASPPNLLVLLFFNGVYESSGGQPLPSDRMDLEGVARAAGFPLTAKVDSVKGFEETLARFLPQNQLGFITLLTAPQSPGRETRYPAGPLEIRAKFGQWIREHPP